MDLGSKEAAQHDGATQTDGDAHGGGLDLQGTGTVGVSLETNLYWVWELLASLKAPGKNMSCVLGSISYHTDQ